jgi:hypothetical protein
MRKRLAEDRQQGNSVIRQNINQRETPRLLDPTGEVDK